MEVTNDGPRTSLTQHAQLSLMTSDRLNLHRAYRSAENSKPIRNGE